TLTSVSTRTVGRGTPQTSAMATHITGSISQGRTLTVRKGRISIRRLFPTQIRPTPKRFTKGRSAFGELRTGAETRPFWRQTATTFSCHLYHRPVVISFRLGQLARQT